MRRSFLVMGTAFVLLLLAFCSPSAGAVPHPPVTSPMRAAGSDLTIRASVPLTTATPGITTTPTSDPEFQILQYVVTHNPSWACQSPRGTPGHLYIADCHPYGYFSHPTTGYVDNYGDPSAAQAQWANMREAARTTYPLFGDLDYSGYPGYYAGNTNYPYAHYENYFWGSVWVMGAVSSDDTSYRGSPWVAGAIFQAAQVLGYLPTLTATPSPIPATVTPTPTPLRCDVFLLNGTSSCTPPDTYGYDFEFYAYGCGNEATVTVRFEVAPGPSGPWTTYGQQVFPNHVFHAGNSNLTGTFVEPGIPAQYTHYRVSIEGVPGPNCCQSTASASICGTTATATITPTGTPRSTATPGVPCSVYQSGATWSACTGNGTYDYRIDLQNYCNTPIHGTGTRVFQVAPSASGPWTDYDQAPFDGDFPPGQLVSVTGPFTEPSIPPPYTWWRVRLQIQLSNGMALYLATGVGTTCAGTSATPSPTGTPTAPGPPICEVFAGSASSSCAGADQYTYSFSYSNITCPVTHDVTLSFEAAAGAGGPWSTIDVRHFTYTFGYPGGAVTGTLTESGIPAQFAYYRIMLSGIPGPSCCVTTSARPLCTSVTPTACSIQFTDVPADSPFYAGVRCLACTGVISGYGDGTYRPYNNVTRSQAAKIVMYSAGISDPIPPAQQTFADVPPSHPFWLYVERLAGRNIVSGYTCGGAGEPCDGGHRPYFRPYGNLTRGQMAKIVAVAGGYTGTPAQQVFEDVPPSHPFYIWISQLGARGVISGYTCGALPAGPCVLPDNRPYYLPQRWVTRGQTAKIVSNALNCRVP